MRTVAGRYSRVRSIITLGAVLLLAAEVWQGFPPMREQYFPSRRALKARVEALVARLAMADGVPGATQDALHP